MNVRSKERAIELGEYIVKNRTTVRETAKEFGVSKSTVHTDVTERLKRGSLTLVKPKKSEKP